MSALRVLHVAVPVLLLAAPTTALAQRSNTTPVAKPSANAARESRSADLAAELARLLQTMKLNNIAAKQADGYVGALYQPGIQLIVVSGKFASGDRMNYLITQKSYSEAYADLNSASQRESRMLVNDLGANGLQFKREKDQPFDMVDLAGKTMSFDGKWGGKENPSREEYAQTYDTSDERYTQMLQSLIDELKKSS